MKKLIFLLVAMFITTTISAQLLNFANHGCGAITFRDGHEETYDWVKLPTTFTDKIDAKNKNQKKQTFSGKDILCITYWHEKQPDKKYTLYCLQVEEFRKKGKFFSEWGMPIMGSKWGVIFRCFESYQFDPYAGEFYKWVSSDHSWQPLLLQRADMDHAVWVGCIRNYNDRKTKEKVAEYCWPTEKATEGAKIFIENPDIYQQILNKTLKASDLQYILDQM